MHMTPLYKIGGFCLVLLVLVMSGCQNTPAESQLGYIEAELTYISSNVSGYLEHLPVERGAAVKTATVLYKLNVYPEQYQQENAQAELIQAEANLKSMRIKLNLEALELKRKKKLFEKKVLSPESYDQARYDYDNAGAVLQQAQAGITAKQASLKTAAWQLSHKSGIAPTDSTVYDVYYRIGEYVPAQQPIVSLLVPAEIKVIYYVKQSRVAQLRIGDTLQVNDGAGHQIEARIRYISQYAEYTPPLIFSNDTNSKLVFRVEAHFTKPSDQYFHPGQPVTVTTSTHDA